MYMYTLQCQSICTNPESILSCYMYNLTLFCLQTIVEQARAVLETIDGVTTVHGRFYELCSNYHKVSTFMG